MTPTNALGRRRPQMIENLRAWLRSTQRRPDIVGRYCRAESVRFAA